MFCELRWIAYGSYLATEEPTREIAPSVRSKLGRTVIIHGRDMLCVEMTGIVSTGTITIEELAEHVIAETGAGVEPVYDEAREADARHTHADVSKARELIGYEPETSIREGVSRFVDWYRENRKWYEPLVRAS